MLYSGIGQEQNLRAAALWTAILVEVDPSSMLRARLWIKGDNPDNELFGSNGCLRYRTRRVKVLYV